MAQVFYSMSKKQRNEAVFSLAMAGLNHGQIADRLGCSHSAISGIASSLRRDGCVMPHIAKGRRPSGDGPRIAEEMANGCPTIRECARRLSITASTADRIWQSIKRDLGAQAV